jgi:hypothetical protein
MSIMPCLERGPWLPCSKRKETFEGVDASARALPFLAAVPLELGLHGLGHAPTVGETELGQHGARGGHAEVLDEVFAQKSHRHRIEQQRSLSGEADHAAFRVELQQLFGSRSPTLITSTLLRFDGKGTSFD